MTAGQKTAIRELEHLHSIAPDIFDAGVPRLVGECVFSTISLRLGPVESKEGGLRFREREEFVLIIPSDYPFDEPSLLVTHSRFAGFPHVNWVRNLCLYQSKIEWNPADGLYGFFGRLKIWLGRAAMNNMDPIEGPLHPPVHITDRSLIPFVVRANAPVSPPQSWLGLAELIKLANRIELLGWNDLTGPWPSERLPALAIFLPEALPVEFPTSGKEFFAILAKQGINKDSLVDRLKIAASLTPENEPAYLVLGMPMRRSPDGKSKHHIAIWAIDAKYAKNLRDASSSNDTSDSIRTIQDRIVELVYNIFEIIPMKWCPVLEDRSEITVRRDAQSSLSWFLGKRVLILGCGALGSWAAEIIARTNPNVLHLVDNSMVKPGLLARQNYCLNDIGSNKAAALAERIRAIAQIGSVEHFPSEAHRFLTENLERLRAYDVVLDCTASSLFQMKLERDWHLFEKRTPTIISMIIDAKAEHCLGVILGSNSSGGLWNGYIQLKYKLCLEGGNEAIINAFYSEQSSERLFQPEPGCSDPTFSGSTADVASVVAGALNLFSEHCVANDEALGIAFTRCAKIGKPTFPQVIRLARFQEASVGEYKVRIFGNVNTEAKAWVLQNNRIRSKKHETGGVLWGLWDNSIDVIWIFDASGPPPDSLHDPGHFVCGTVGTAAEHRRRFERSRNTAGFVGFWHTHPDMASVQSNMDIGGMANLVSEVGANQKRALMLIFGRTRNTPTAGVYVYESELSHPGFIAVGGAQVSLSRPVV